MFKRRKEKKEKLDRVSFVGIGGVKKEHGTWSTEEFKQNFREYLLAHKHDMVGEGPSPNKQIEQIVNQMSLEEIRQKVKDHFCRPPITVPFPEGKVWIGKPPSSGAKEEIEKWVDKMSEEGVKEVLKSSHLIGYIWHNDMPTPVEVLDFDEQVERIINKMSLKDVKNIMEFGYSVELLNKKGKIQVRITPSKARRKSSS